MGVGVRVRASVSASVSTSSVVCSESSIVCRCVPFSVIVLTTCYVTVKEFVDDGLDLVGHFIPIRMFTAHDVVGTGMLFKRGSITKTAHNTA